MLKKGDEVIASKDLYGGTYRLLTQTYQKFGIRCVFADLNDLEKVQRLITSSTRMVFAETPSNPLLVITDLIALAALCKRNSIWLAVDNTFATPYFQNPLDLGAHLVVHSATKYLGGHSDTLLGAVVTNLTPVYKKLQFIQNSGGAVPGPLDCFLVLRGIKTLHLRMERHAANTRQIACFLNSHPAVEHVFWFGHEDHPQHIIARQQMRGFGGVVSFTLRDAGKAEALKLLSKTHLFLPAEGLGGVESLINHPATMSHSAVPAHLKRKNGITDHLIRLSVGIEDAGDLIRDLQQALVS